VTDRPTGWALWIHAVRPVPELVDLARYAEELGAAALLVADEGIDRDLYVTLTAVAGATERLLLIPAITNPHSRHPVATAAALASLEEVAPGRVVAGLGAGGSLVFDPMGLRPPRPFSALREAVEVIDRLLGGEVVDHAGQFSTVGAAIEWSPGRLPIALAGRGPRVEQLTAERADVVILSGKAIAEVPEVVARLRAGRPGTGRPAVVWNPAAAWHPAHVDEVRSHFAYMTVDTPAEERRALGVSDEAVTELRAAVHRDGPQAAAHLVPDAITHRYAIVGTRDEVVARLNEARLTVQPELIAFSAHEYSATFLKETAEVAADAGLVSGSASAAGVLGRTLTV
jgi:5,10-methylenetetrahydromethanopterin reductase